MKAIAHIRTGFPEKFGIPRQSGIVNELKGRIVFEPEYRNPDAFRGLEEFSHIWVLWEFSEAKRDNWSPTVRPPRLGGNTRVGVFATRSPFRPNNIGLSCVKLDKIELSGEEGPVIHVSGVDMMDGTPVFDIKPYIPYADSHPEAKGGFTDTTTKRTVNVHISEEFEAVLGSERTAALRGLLAQDPRPAYKEDSDRVYRFDYDGFQVSFSCKEGLLTVLSIKKLNKKENK